MTQYHEHVNVGRRTSSTARCRYNNLDVTPFLEAVDKMYEHWKSLGIDMFKHSAVSLPGLCERHMYNTMDKDIVIPLWHQKDKAWHYKVRDNVVGGPSIVFCRRHVAYVTMVRGGRLCVRVVGFDVNGLYLWGLCQKMPTGLYYIWHVVSGAKGQKRAASGATVLKRTQGYPNSNQEYHWIMWKTKQLALERGTELTVQHRFNGGQKRIGNGGVDGFVPELNTVLQFYGCKFHGHGCQSVLDPEVKADAAQRTAEREREVLDHGHELETMYQCDYQRALKTDPAMRAFVDDLKVPGNTTTLSAEELLALVKQDKWFGLVECDITVPDDLKDHFSEMTPIFKNCEIGIDDIGPTMAAVAKSTGQLNKPRRALIGSYHGEKIVLATPLLKWYLDHGLQVTKVYGAVQFKGQE
jgi:hypothetical protein